MINVIQIQKISFQVSSEPDNIKPKHTRGCDKSVMSVEFSDESTKKLCCPYCDKLVVKLARHMEVKHKEEQEVKRFLSFPKGNYI